MTEQFYDILKTRNGKVRFKKLRTYTTGTAGQYSKRAGNAVPYRTVEGATIPMPSVVTANDISTTGFRLVIGGGDYTYEVSEDGVILSVSKEKEIMVTGRLPSSTTVLDVVAVRSDGSYSLAHTVSVKTLPGQSKYPYSVGDSEPARAEPPSLSSPQQVSLSFVTPTTARISWTPSVKTTGIEWHEAVLGGTIVAVTTAGFVDVSGLTSGVSYTAKVRAVNSMNQFSSITQDTRTAPDTVDSELPAGSIDAIEGEYV